MVRDTIKKISGSTGPSGLDADADTGPSGLDADGWRRILISGTLEHHEKI